MYQYVLAVILSYMVILALPHANAENYNFEIWASPSEITLGSYSTFSLKICPTPSTDQGREVITDHKTGIITDPGSQILVNWYETRPNGSQVMHQYLQPYSCESSWWFGALSPDSVGTYSIRAEAIWFEQGSIQKIQSNIITVVVQEPIFKGKLEKLVDMERIVKLLELDPDKIKNSAPPENLQFYQFDWSASGNLITFTTFGPSGWSIWLMSADGKELNIIEIPKFEAAGFPRIAPSEDSIVFFAQHDSDRLDLFKYDIKEEKISQITRTEFTNSTVQFINGFDWMPDGNIVYVEGSRERMTGKADFQLWLADSDGNKIKKLFSRSRDTGVADASPDGHKILLASGRIFDVDKGELDGIISSTIIDRGGYARWSPSGDLLVYSSIGAYGPGGTMYITSADGSYDQVLHTGIPKPVDPAISPDGRFIIFGSPIGAWDTYDNAGIYRMELSKAIPEFPFAIIIASLAIGAMIALRFGKLSVPRILKLQLIEDVFSTIFFTFSSGKSS